MNRFLISLIIFHAAVLGAVLAGAEYTIWVSILGTAWCLFMTYITRSRK